MLEIRGIWLCHMSWWDRYVLRPRVRAETSESEIVPHIGPYTLLLVAPAGRDAPSPPASLVRSGDRCSVVLDGDGLPSLVSVLSSSPVHEPRPSLPLASVWCDFRGGKFWALASDFDEEDELVEAPRPPVLGDGPASSGG